MPVQTLVQSQQIHALETGLRDIRRSQLLRQPEVKAMCTAIEKHHQNVRLSHLTGKAKDIIKQDSQDTKFYYILVRMLGEILHSGTERQRNHIETVYKWYQSNNHVLHTGPRFGRQKETAIKHSVSHDSLDGSFGKFLREIHSPQEKIIPEQFIPEKQREIQNTQNESNAKDRDPALKRPHTVAVTDRKESQKTKGSDSYDDLLPKRRTVPLSHLFNPHARDLHKTVQSEIGGDKSEIASPVRLNHSNQELSQNKENDQIDYKRKWDSFKQEFSYGQDVLSKLQHVGRHGIPSGVRYTAHDHGLSAEKYTRDVINGYVKMEQFKKPDDLSHKPKSRLNEAKLEKFYELTEIPPQKTIKYPSFNKARAKSAPLGRQLTPGVKKHEASNKTLDQTTSENMLVPELKQKQDLTMKLDTVVGMIDTVTDEMSYFKEKLAPDPQVGFRQPTIHVDYSVRPSTAPVGSIARPASPEDFHYKCKTVQRIQDSPGFLNEMQNICHETVNSRQESSDSHLTMFNVIDWRGKVTAEVSEARWNNTPMSQHSYVKISTPAVNTLRSAGSTHAGGRPRTAPAGGLQRWGRHQAVDELERTPQAVSHQAKEPNPETVQDLLQVQHLCGSAKRKRSRHFKINYDYYIERQPRPCTTTGVQNKEYISLATAKTLGGSSRPESPSKTAGSSSNDPASALSIPQVRTESGENDSLSHCIDPQNMDDFEEELGEDPFSCQSAEQGLNYDIDDFAHLNSSVDRQESTDVGLNEIGQKITSEYNIGENDELLDDITRLLGRESLYDENVRNETSNDIDATAETEIHHHKNLKDSAGNSLGEKTQLDPHINKSSLSLKKSTYWNYVPELDLAGNELEEHIREIERDLIPATPRNRLQTKTGLAFPRSPSAPVNQGRDQCPPPELTVVGVSTDMSRVRSPGTSTDMSRARSPGTSTDMSRARSAGTVPARAKNTTRHAVLLKQQEMLRKSPVRAYRSSPSIPSPFNQYGTRSPRCGTTYSSELEMHAKKDHSPRHYLEKVNHLRTPSNKFIANENDMPGEARPPTVSIRVMKMRAVGQRYHNTPSPNQSGHPGTPVEGLPEDTISGHYSMKGGDAASEPVSPSALRRSSQEIKRGYLESGRPISDYLEHVEPETHQAAVEKLHQAKAAVDIQRIFRGYIARNHYKYLQREVREMAENKRQAALEIQRAYRKHLQRKRAIVQRAAQPEIKAAAKLYEETLREKQTEREHKAQVITTQNARNKSASDAKIAIIGPHVAVYEPFHPKKTGFRKWQLNAAATAIQRRVRGWIIRLKFERLKRKAQMHGGSWEKFLRFYKNLIFKVQTRLGEERPKFYFDFNIIGDFMDTKHRYEQVFDRKAFGNEMEIEDLLQFFQECDLFPAYTEVQDTLRSVVSGAKLRQGQSLVKQEVLEVAFQIYPPKGTDIVSRRQSTWMNPIIDGEEAIKFKGTEGVEHTDFETCWNLVSSSQRERVIAARKQDEARRENEWQQKHGKDQALVNNGEIQKRENDKTSATDSEQKVLLKPLLEEEA